MKKKLYEKPTMEVDELEQQTPLLAASNPSASTAENFSWDDDDDDVSNSRDFSAKNSIWDDDWDND